MNITLAFTTWNSANWIEKQLAKNYMSLSDGLIDEIVIQDDASSDYEALVHHECDKIKIFRNEENLSPLLSRQELVKNCKNEWILLMDSDNFLVKENSSGINCFDLLKSLELNLDTIYCPGFKGHWGYNHLCNVKIDMDFTKKHFNDPAYYMATFLNTGNYLIPKKTYLEVGNEIDKTFSHFTVDVIYFNYLWLRSGRYLHCISDYEYEHTIRPDNTNYTLTHGAQSQDKLRTVSSFFNI